MSIVRLVLSCGYERKIDSMTLDKYGIENGHTGWCPEHEDATVDAMFIDDDFRVRLTMSAQTVNVVCAKAPRRIGCVPAVRVPSEDPRVTFTNRWRCSFCGARVKVVA